MDENLGLKPLTKQEVERLAVSTADEVEQLEQAVERLFTYGPWDDAQHVQNTNVVDTLVAAYKAIVKNVAPGPTRTRALNAVIDARLHANTAITFPGE